MGCGSSFIGHRRKGVVMDGATIFVLFLVAGFVAFILYLALLSKRMKRQTQSQSTEPANEYSRKDAA
jgi:hypothetical protein